VILFTNTSPSEEGMRDFSAIFLEIWKHAEALKKEQLRRQNG
jgi:hypothetical protein